MIVQKSAAVLLALYSGLAIILQNGINANLNATAVPSPFCTAAVCYTVGLISILSLSILIDKPSSCWLGSSRGGGEDDSILIWTAPWYAWCGRLLGVVYVMAAIVLTPRLGFCLFQLAVICGQLTCGMICDAIGFLNLELRHVTPWRILCLTLFCFGTAMTSSRNKNDNKDDEADSVHSGTLFAIHSLYIAGAVLAGGMFPIQSCANYEMTRHVGTPFRAVVINFFVGAIAVWALTGIQYIIMIDKAEPLFVLDTNNVPWWMWVGGGVLGSSLITSAVIGLPSLGAVAFTSIFISTQLVIATVLDATGAFTFDVVPIGRRRLCGILLALVAAIAFQQRSPMLLEKWWIVRQREQQEETTPLLHKQDDGEITSTRGEL